MSKEHPILFSAPMVRAILEGRKTVTRRVMKLQPDADADITVERYHVSITNRQGFQEPGAEIFGAWWREGEAGCKCPYGQPGDRLWVRESFWHAGDWVQTYPEDDSGDWCGTKRVHYRADGAPPNEPNHHYPNGLRNGAYSAADPAKIWRARPSIHMPRWASRILLEITDVRVERLQAISRADIRAEGLQCPAELASDDVSPNYRDWYPAAWRELWESINGPDSWSANPWVWVIKFKRVTP